MTEGIRNVPLRRLAHGRTGDKGDRSNISVICRRAESYAFIAEWLTEERVTGIFSFRNVSSVRRYDLPHLASFNLVLDHALDGGVNRSLLLDRHGKGLSALLLGQILGVPVALLDD